MSLSAFWEETLFFDFQLCAMLKKWTVEINLLQLCAIMLGNILNSLISIYK